MHRARERPGYIGQQFDQMTRKENGYDEEKRYFPSD